MMRNGHDSNTATGATEAGFRFCFTLDTEPDNLWSWSPTLKFDHVARLASFHRQLVSAGARPTYLTTSEIAENAEAAKILTACREEDNCEIGAHFHAWTRRWPFPTRELGSPPTMAMAHQLGQGEEERMLAYTCRQIREKLGVTARSYRGGRWSLGWSTARSLLNCGIDVDSTVTPGVSWRSRRSPLEDGPDWTRFPCRPSWLTSPAKYGSEEVEPGCVLELPVGAAMFPQGLGPLFGPELSKALCRRISRWSGTRIGHRWLRPTTQSVDDMRATMVALKRAGSPVWVFMIHSSEIVPCHFMPDEAAVDAFRERCAAAVRCAVELGAEAATLSEAAEWVRRCGNVNETLRPASDASAPAVLEPAGHAPSVAV